MMQFDRDLVLAGIFDRPLQNDFMSIDFYSKLVLEPINDVLRSNRPERLSCFAGF